MEASIRVRLTNIVWAKIIQIFVSKLLLCIKKILCIMKTNIWGEPKVTQNISIHPLS